MNEKTSKMGRPTDAKKDVTIKVRIDEETKNMIDQCVKKTGLSKSEIVRSGIAKVYQEIKGDM